MLVAEMTGLPGASACPSDSIAFQTHKGIAPCPPRRRREDENAVSMTAAIDARSEACERPGTRGEGMLQHACCVYGGLLRAARAGLSRATQDNTGRCRWRVSAGA
jgi:hypothetical protein